MHCEVNEPVDFKSEIRGLRFVEWLMPNWKREIRTRLAGLELEPAREAAIVEEVAQHLEDFFQELIANGATPKEAVRRTLAELSEDDFLARELRRVERQAGTAPVVFGTNRRSNMI